MESLVPGYTLQVMKLLKKFEEEKQKMKPNNTIKVSAEVYSLLSKSKDYAGESNKKATGGYIINIKGSAKRKSRDKTKLKIGLLGARQSSTMSTPQKQPSTLTK